MHSLTLTSLKAAQKGWRFASTQEKPVPALCRISPATKTPLGACWQGRWHISQKRVKRRWWKALGASTDSTSVNIWDARRSRLRAAGLAQPYCKEHARWRPCALSLWAAGGHKTDLFPATQRCKSTVQLVMQTCHLNCLLMAFSWGGCPHGQEAGALNTVGSLPVPIPLLVATSGQATTPSLLGLAASQEEWGSRQGWWWPCTAAPSSLLVMLQWAADPSQRQNGSGLGFLNMAHTCDSPKEKTEVCDALRLHNREQSAG